MVSKGSLHKPHIKVSGLSGIRKKRHLNIQVSDYGTTLKLCSVRWVDWKSGRASEVFDALLGQFFHFTNGLGQATHHKCAPYLAVPVRTVWQ